MYQLLREEGLFLGLSSGINVAGAVRFAKESGPGQTIVTILCDSGHKYQSTLFNRDWLASNHLDPDLPLESILDDNLKFLNQESRNPLSRKVVLELLNGQECYAAMQKRRSWILFYRGELLFADSDFPRLSVPSVTDEAVGSDVALVWMGSRRLEWVLA